MNTKLNGKTVIYALLALLVLIFVIGSFRASHRLGTGLAFDRFMTTTGLSSADWEAMSPDRKESVISDVRTKAIPSAALRSVSSLCLGLLALVSVAYTFRERMFTRLNSTLMGIALSALAGLSSGAATVSLTNNSGAWYGAVGIAILSFLLFYLLTGILALFRKFAVPRG